MKTNSRRALFLAALAGAAGLSSSRAAQASNPLEYPDNGSAAFSRGGAWLGVANEPIATHYNPAGLATQGSGFSVEQQLNFPKTCYHRQGPGGTPVGPDDTNTLTSGPGAGMPRYIYLPVCNERTSFPNTIPSISFAFRLTDKLGVGMAIVAPATYGTADNAFPLMARGYNLGTGQYQTLPAPYRYMQLNQLSTILFPTVGVGYELFQNFRVGAAFISGIAAINTSTTGIATFSATPQDLGNEIGDHSPDDSVSNLRTKDLFVPGVILSAHWSVLPQLDVAVWGRYLDAIRTSSADFTATTDVFEGVAPRPVCTNVDVCSGAVPNNAQTNPEYFRGSVLTHFKYPLPPEVRIGVRFHQPRNASRLVFGDRGKARDPLHDDLFDVELNGSYSMNSYADTIEVRFRQGVDPVTGRPTGTGAALTRPTGVPIPPNADRWTGYQDSYGVRLGGQWNAIADKLGIRAGAWYETRSQDPAWLTIAPVGGARWGYGGGIVLRQDFIDISFGYQRHESAGLDNGGDGRMRAATGTASGQCNGGNFNLSCDAGKNAAERTQFRSIHTVNGGKVTFSADVFTIGGTVRF